MFATVRNIIRKYNPNSRTFSRSCGKKANEKNVPEKQERTIDQSHLPPTLMRLVEPKDRIVLLYGSKGKYKTKEEIPNHVPITELLAAQTRLRIKIANIMMVFFLTLFLYTCLDAKRRVSQGESRSQERLNMIEQWQKEGAKEREAARLASSTSSKTQ